MRPLRGATGVWRLRVAGWRVRYRPDRAARRIEVLAVAPRGDAYKGR